MHPRPTATLIVLLAAGCSSSPHDDAPASGISTNPVTGNVSTVAQRDLDTARAAARAALSELNLTITQDLRDPSRTVMDARAADDRTVSITITKLGEQSARIDISAGPIHRPLAHAVMTQIRARL